MKKVKLLILLGCSFICCSVYSINKEDSVKNEPKNIHNALELEDEDYTDDTVATNLSFSDFYKSFDTQNIHYPRGMVNYADTAMKDTIHIPLVWDSSIYSSPTEWNYVTSKFGKRKWRYHYGTDFRLQRGDPVMACFDGVVRISKYSKSYGNIVVLRHSNGLESYYGHLSQRKVGIGDTVKSGEVIGLGGSTGRSYGNHLHLELRYLGTPINPEDIVDFSKGELYCDTLHLCAYNFRYLREVAQLSAIVWHTVRNGETLGALARRYGTSVAAIRRWNGIPSSGSRANLIRVKQRLRVR